MKSEREKQISCINTYIRNLEKCRAGIEEKERVDLWTQQGEEGMGPSGRAALTCIRKARELGGWWGAAVKPGSSAQGSAVARGLVGGGQEAQEGGAMCEVASARCCMAETNTTL